MCHPVVSKCQIIQNRTVQKWYKKFVEKGAAPGEDLRRENPGAPRIDEEKENLVGHSYIY